MRRRYTASHEPRWLLVETLGAEPVVVAQGRQMKNLVPAGPSLRRNPNLAAVQTAIAETVASGNRLASIPPRATASSGPSRYR